MDSSPQASNFYERLLATARSTPSPQAAAEADAFNAARLGLPRPEEPKEPLDRLCPEVIEVEDEGDHEGEEDAVEDTWCGEMAGLALRMKEIWPLPSDTPKPAEDADAAATGGDAVVAVEEAWPLDTTEEAAEAALIKNLGAAPPPGGPSQPPPAASQCPAFLRRQEVLARSGDLDAAVLKVCETGAEKSSLVLSIGLIG